MKAGNSHWNVLLTHPYLRPPARKLVTSKCKLYHLSPEGRKKHGEHSLWINTKLSRHKIRTEGEPQPVLLWPTAKFVQVDSGWVRTANVPVCEVSSSHRLLGPMPVFYPMILLLRTARYKTITQRQQEGIKKNDLTPPRVPRFRNQQQNRDSDQNK